MPSGRAKTLLANTLLFVASCLTTLVAGEIGLRLAGISYPSFHVMDEVLGIRLRPGAEGWFRSEGEAYVKINSAGFRDRERSLAKGLEVYRIAVLGDSFAEALQVPLEATFWSRLERHLGACRAFGERPVEVLNFSVSNYGTAQQLLALRRDVWPYSPDMVLLAFLPSNDVRNNSRELEPGKERPFFQVRNGLLELDSSFFLDRAWQEAKRQGEQRRVLADLRLYQVLRRIKTGEYRGWNDAPAAARMASGEAVGLAEIGSDEQIFRAPDSRAWSEAWLLTERLIEAIRDEAAAHGARFVLTSVSTGPSVFPDPALRRRYAESLGVPDLFYPERRLLQLSVKLDFQYVPLGPPLQRVADATGTYLHGFANTRLGFGHWNAAGHSNAAELIAKRLCPPEQVRKPGIL